MNGSEIPNYVVGETVPLDIGPLDAEVEIHAYEYEITSVTYKPNQVHVHARSTTPNRTEGVVGSVEFTLTKQAWIDLNEQVRLEKEGGA